MAVKCRLLCFKRQVLRVGSLIDHYKSAVVLSQKEHITCFALSDIFLSSLSVSDCGPADIMILMDTSSDVPSATFDAQKTFVNDLLAGFNIGMSV